MKVPSDNQEEVGNLNPFDPFPTHAYGCLDGLEDVNRARGRPWNLRLAGEIDLRCACVS